MKIKDGIYDDTKMGFRIWVASGMTVRYQHKNDAGIDGDEPWGHYPDLPRDVAPATGTPESASVEVRNTYLTECADCTRGYERWCSYFHAKKTCDRVQYLKGKRVPFEARPDLVASLAECHRHIESIAGDNTITISKSTENMLNQAVQRADTIAAEIVRLAGEGK